MQGGVQGAPCSHAHKPNSIENASTHMPSSSASSHSCENDRQRQTGTTIRSKAVETPALVYRALLRHADAVGETLGETCDSWLEIFHNMSRDELIDIYEELWDM